MYNDLNHFCHIYDVLVHHLNAGGSLLKSFINVFCQERHVLMWFGCTIMSAILVELTVPHGYCPGYKLVKIMLQFLELIW